MTLESVDFENDGNVVIYWMKNAHAMRNRETEKDTRQIKNLLISG